jgi:hypothetical protein
LFREQTKQTSLCISVRVKKFMAFFFNVSKSLSVVGSWPLFPQTTRCMPVWHAFGTDMLQFYAKKKLTIFSLSFTGLENCRKSLCLADFHCTCTVKKRLPVFPSPAGMLLTESSLAGNNLIFPGQGQFGK